MADQTDVEDSTVEDEPTDWKEPPLQKRSIFAGVNWGGAVLRFVAIVFAACGIGYAIAYVTNSRTYQRFTTESKLDLTPSGPPLGHNKPGRIVHRAQKVKEADGHDVGNGSDAAVQNPSSPTVVKPPDKGNERVK